MIVAILIQKKRRQCPVKERRGRTWCTLRYIDFSLWRRGAQRATFSPRVKISNPFFVHAYILRPLVIWACNKQKTKGNMIKMSHILNVSVISSHNHWKYWQCTFHCHCHNQILTATTIHRIFSTKQTAHLSLPKIRLLRIYSKHWPRRTTKRWECPCVSLPVPVIGLL